MPYIIPQPIRELTAPYVAFKSHFTPEECAMIIEISKTQVAQKGRIGAKMSDVKGEVVAEKRRCDVYWIDWEQKYNALFDKIAQAVGAANAKWWGFHLAGLNESLQLTHYKSDDQGFYDWHEDMGIEAGFQHRKISGVIQLNEGFEGGEFEFANLKPSELSLGTMILFPSYKLHRVNPVVKGERWSLVFWVTGPAFV